MEIAAPSRKAARTTSAPGSRQSRANSAEASRRARATSVSCRLPASLGDEGVDFAPRRTCAVLPGKGLGAGDCRVHRRFDGCYPDRVAFEIEDDLLSRLKTQCRAKMGWYYEPACGVDDGGSLCGSGCGIICHSAGVYHCGAEWDGARLYHGSESSGQSLGPTVSTAEGRTKVITPSLRRASPVSAGRSARLHADRHALEGQVHPDERSRRGSQEPGRRP